MKYKDESTKRKKMYKMCLNEIHFMELRGVLISTWLNVKWHVDLEESYIQF